MGHRKITICILTALLVAATLFFGIREAEGEVPFSFLAVTEEGTETIHFWQNADGEGFVFLPSYVNLENLQIHTNGSVQFDDRTLRYGDTCGDLEWNRPYALSRGPKSLTFLQSGNMPTLYIDTASGGMEEIHKLKGNEEPGNLRLYTPDGELAHLGRLEFIKSRGNGTFDQPKKPYSLKLAQSADLLGMGTANKWILLANALDESQIKNKWSFDFAAAAGLPYTPDSRWVELYLNGQYAGLYLLAERNEVHPQRVALKDGQGFLFTQDYYERLVEQNLPHFLTEANVPVRIYQSTWDQNEMQSFVQSAENAILAEDGIDPETGKHWSEFIDLDSWARKYLLEEILGGGDAGFLSQFFHYEGNDPEGKIFAGPAWDYDYTMGIDRYWDSVPNMFYAKKAASSPWLNGLYGKDEFYDYMTRLFREEIHPLLLTYLNETFPAYAAQVADAARLDAARWGGDPAKETERALNYMRARAEFLEDVWVNGTDYAEVTVIQPYSMELFALDYAVPRGTALPEFLAKKPWDWFMQGTDEPFDITAPVKENVTVYALIRPEPEGPEEAWEEAEPEAVESHVNWELRLPLYAIALLMMGLFVTDGLRMRKKKPISAFQDDTPQKV